MSRERAASFLGLFVAVLLFLAIAVVFPEDGPDSTSIAQGLALGAIVAAGPVASLVSRLRPSSLAALAGGMTIAGVATTPGGNLSGLVMAIAGLLLLAGVTTRGVVGLIGPMVGYAVSLVIGIYAALAGGVGTVIALSIALAVATSPRWLPGRGSVARPPVDRSQEIS